MRAGYRNFQFSRIRDDKEKAGAKLQKSYKLAMIYVIGLPFIYQAVDRKVCNWSKNVQVWYRWFLWWPRTAGRPAELVSATRPPRGWEGDFSPGGSRPAAEHRLLQSHGSEI